MARVNPLEIEACPILGNDFFECPHILIKCTLNSVARAHDGGRESLKEIVSVERKGDFEDAHMAAWLGSTVLAIS